MDRTIPNNASVAEKSEGALNPRVISQPDGVVVDFGKPVSWIGLSPQEAVDFAALIIKHANDVAARTGEQLRLVLDAGVDLQQMGSVQ
jgi:hypothetical protein